MASLSSRFVKISSALSLDLATSCSTIRLFSVFPEVWTNYLPFHPILINDDSSGSPDTAGVGQRFVNCDLMWYSVFISRQLLDYLWNGQNVCSLRQPNVSRINIISAVSMNVLEKLISKS